MFTRFAGTVSCILGLMGAAAVAQTYPDRPIRLIVPQPPGGGFDLVGRITADRLGTLLGQTVIVENKTGSGTLVGTDSAAKASPDGYTLLLAGLPNIVLNIGLYPKLPYDPAKDFALVGMAVSFTYGLVARKDLPQKDVKELLAFATANPDKLIYASGGRGTGQHIAMAVTAQLANVKMTHLPYRGAQAAYQDILGGRVDLFFDNISTVLPLAEADQVRVLAVSSKARHPRLPNVPTIGEAGVPNFEMESWFGIFAPSATPKPILDRLRGEMAKVVENPSFSETFLKTGGIPMKMPVAEGEALIASETGRWVKLIKDAGVTAE
jgi:tripartite-type tricarboxylate transporter receptor subunit TctC